MAVKWWLVHWYEHAATAGFSFALPTFYGFVHTHILVGLY